MLDLKIKYLQRTQKSGEKSGQGSLLLGDTFISIILRKWLTCFFNNIFFFFKQVPGYQNCWNVDMKVWKMIILKLFTLLEIGYGNFNDLLTSNKNLLTVEKAAR